MASWSACRAQATRCATRRSPSSPSRRCCEHLGLDVHGVALRNRNVASVIVTTDLSRRRAAGRAARRDGLGARRRAVADGRNAAADPAPGRGRRRLRDGPGRGRGDRIRSAGPGRRRCRRACRPPAGFPTARSSSTKIPALPDQLRSMLELKNPDYATAVQDRRRDQRLFPRAIPRPRGATRSTAERSNCSVRAMSRSRASWPRSASCRSSRTWPRAWCSTREPARSSSVRTCRSRPSRSPTER